MTSEDRKENRYQRRKERRIAKKQKALENVDDFDKVFTFKHLYVSYKRCRRNVTWKSSVQKYCLFASLNVYTTLKKLRNGKYKSPGFFEFDLFERGKKRHIRSTVIDERVVQRCLCDFCLVPALGRTFIYDNGASMKNKGYDFAIKRVTEQLRRHYRKYGNSGYALLFDFSKFFDNVSHKLVKRIICNELSDERIVKLTEHFVDAFGNVGLGLGSQISQILALASANDLDHEIKEKLIIKLFERYMDDGIMTDKSKAHLIKVRQAIGRICKILDIKLNEKKTQIVKLSHGFTWLKVRFFLTKNGKVVRKISKESIKRCRKRMKKLYKRWLRGLVPFCAIYKSFRSWYGYSLRFNAWHTRNNMTALYNSLLRQAEREESYGLYQVS